MQLIGNIRNLSLFEIIGLLLLAYLFVWKPVKCVFQWLLNNCTRKSFRILKPGPNDYAVITGASDGIGLEYARQLAAKGYKLVLLSRTEEKLKRVAQEIRQQYPQCDKVDYLAVDFTQSEHIYDRIREKLDSLEGPIRVLVNNVGVSYDHPEYFHQIGQGFHRQLINVNILALTSMCEIVLQIMVNQMYDPNVSPTRGVIVNISSGLGLSEYPLFSTYGASKAYVKYLSNCLAAEYAKTGIIVQTVTPNLVRTNMTRNLEGSFMVQAVDMVRYALKAVGTEQQTSAHPTHKFFNWLSGWLEYLFGHELYMKIKFSVMKKGRKRYENSEKTANLS